MCINSQPIAIQTVYVTIYPFHLPIDLSIDPSIQPANFISNCSLFLSFSSSLSPSCHVPVIHFLSIFASFPIFPFFLICILSFLYLLSLFAHFLIRFIAFYLFPSSFLRSSRLHSFSCFYKHTASSESGDVQPPPLFQSFSVLFIV